MADQGLVRRQVAGQLAVVGQQLCDPRRETVGQLHQVAQFAGADPLGARRQVVLGGDQHRRERCEHHRHRHLQRQWPAARVQQAPAAVRQPAGQRPTTLQPTCRLVAGRQCVRQRHRRRIGCKQGAAEVVHALRAIGRVRCERPVDRPQQFRAVARGATLGGRRHRIVGAGAQWRVRWLVAEQHPIEGRAERVDVGPRALAAAAVLLDRAVARGDHRHFPFPPAGGSGRAEIEQHQRTVGSAHRDVVGLDVAVHEAGTVHGLEPVQQRRQQIQQIALADATAVRPPLAQGLAALVLEHHVGGVVGLEEAGHAHDVGVAEGSQRARLHQEVLEATQVEVETACAAGADALVLEAIGDLRRQVFLDRHPRMQVNVRCQVGDAEAALSENPLDAIFMQTVSDRQRLAGGRCRADQVGARPRLGQRQHDRLLVVGEARRARRRHQRGEPRHHPGALVVFALGHRHPRRGSWQHPGRVRVAEDDRRVVVRHRGAFGRRPGAGSWAVHRTPPSSSTSSA